MPVAKTKSLDGYQTNVVEDWTDLRDQVYRPSLLPLQTRHSPEDRLLDTRPDPPTLRIRVRDQGEEGSCTGQALAALIDILRIGQMDMGETAQPASARMLFEMAKQQEWRRSPAGDEVFTLRAALKGFYHNGVCSDHDWPYVPGDTKGGLQVDRAKAVRHVTLGAYYRLEPVLNHYHTAIAEVGAIYAAAEIHSGWTRENVRKNGGRILSEPSGSGGHAFVIVGYDDQGFLVLNSWGERWGGFHPTSSVHPLPGIGHWRYQDWADSIRDAWVLRIAAPTPDAFDLTIGTQGLFAGGGRIGQSSTPRADLLGHYIHLDDGDHVETGNYPSTKADVEETFRYLSGARGDGEAQGKCVADDTGHEAPYRHVLIWLTGGVESTKEAFAHAAKVKPRWTRRGIYPINVIWCTDFIEQARVVLGHLFKLAEAQAGGAGEELDVLIERSVQGIGRSFWRDVKRAAKQATRSAGPCTHMIEQASALCETSGTYRLHVVAEGAGAVLLGYFLERLAELPTPAEQRLQASFFNAITTLSLVAPACTVRQFSDSYRSLVAHLGAQETATPKENRRTRSKVALYLPTVALEKRMRVGVYGQSMLHLVANGFEDRDLEARWRVRSSGDLRGPEILGMAPDSFSATRAQVEIDPEFSNVEIKEIGVRADLPDHVGQEEITRNSKVIDAIIRRIGPSSR